MPKGLLLGRAFSRGTASFAALGSFHIGEQLCTLHQALALSRVRPCHIPSCQPANTSQVHMGTDVLATEVPPHQQGVRGCSTPLGSLLVFVFLVFFLGASLFPFWGHYCSGAGDDGGEGSSIQRKQKRGEERMLLLASIQSVS